MTDEEAALVEPVAVAVMAVKKARVTAGSVVLIHGAGPVGLCMYMVAKAVGSVKTIFCDINKKRLDFAKTMGDDIETVLLDPATKELKSVEERKAEYTNETSQARKLAARIIETAQEQPNVCFDTTGVELLQQATIYVSFVFYLIHRGF